MQNTNANDLNKRFMQVLKQKGFSDNRIAELICCSEEDVRSLRKKYDIKPVYKRVDTCAAESFLRQPAICTPHMVVSVKAIRLQIKKY